MVQPEGREQEKVASVEIRHAIIFSGTSTDGDCDFLDCHSVAFYVEPPFRRNLLRPSSR
jgi:hypothetical protein